MSSSDLTEFERAIVRAIYRNERPTEDVPNLSVVLREFSGNGLFVTLYTEESSFDTEDATLGKNLNFSVAGLSHGGGALLYIENGKPKLLEMYVNGYEEWPSTISDYHIEYRY